MQLLSNYPWVYILWVCTAHWNWFSVANVIYEGNHRISLPHSLPSAWTHRLGLTPRTSKYFFLLLMLMYRMLKLWLDPVSLAWLVLGWAKPSWKPVSLAWAPVCGLMISITGLAALCCTAQCTVLYCTLHRTMHIAPHCTLHYTLHCNALHCTPIMLSGWLPSTNCAGHLFRENLFPEPGRSFGMF